MYTLFTLILLIIIAVLVWDIRKLRSGSRIVVTVTQTEPRQQTDPPEKDAWEDWNADLHGPGQRLRQLSGVRLNIHFTDTSGSKTVRDVTTQRYSYNPETKAGVLYAHCHLRNGNRPFAINRISNAVALETGEIIAHVGAFLEAEFEQTPLFAVEQFLAQHDAGMFVLFSLAKADGTMRAKERAVMLDWAKPLGLTEPEALAELEAKLRGWYMTKGAFWDAVKSVKKLERSAEYMASLWQACIAVVMSDKKPHDEEVAFLRYAADKWNIPTTEIPDFVKQPK
jgi:uncharacterized tellurite resistance protein B-like protein